MANKDEKFITKQAAMMAAVSVETYLLTNNYDAMLFWSARLNYYGIIVQYVSTNPLYELEGEIWSEEEEQVTDDGVTKEIKLRFNY